MESHSIKEDFEKVQKMCLGFEDCINNEDKYFKEAMQILVRLVEEIRKDVYRRMAMDKDN